MISLTQDLVEELIRLEAEQDNLDYKSSYHFEDAEKRARTEGKCKFVKDALAMANSGGGYIVIGIDDETKTFASAGSIPSNWEQYSSENLANKIRSYIDTISFHIVAKTFDVADKSGNFHQVCLIGITQPDDPFLFIPFSEDGSYKDNNGHDQLEFRKGQIVIREGCQNQYATYSHLNALIRKRDDFIRKETFKLANHLQAQLLVSNDAPQLITTKEVGKTTLSSPISEIQDAVDVISSAFEEYDGISILQQIGQYAYFAAKARQYDLFSYIIGILKDLYQTYVNKKSDVYDHDALGLLSHLSSMLQVLGGFCVRHSLFKFIPVLVQQPIISPMNTNYIYYSWLRHMQVMLDRNGYVAAKTPENSYARAALLILREYCDEYPTMIQDIHDTSLDDEQKHSALMSSVCGFNLISCVLSTKETGDCNIYPTFSLYDKKYTAPTLSKLTDNDKCRSELEITKSQLEKAFASIRQRIETITDAHWNLDCIV